MAVFTLGPKPNGCPRRFRCRQQLWNAALRQETSVQIGRIYTCRLPGKGIQRGGLCTHQQLGREIDVTVTDRMRRFAWAKFYKASGKRKTGTGQKKRVKRRSKPKELNPQAQFWRNMALTQKKLHIRIPQRQFMGESEELNRRIREKVDQEITNILNQ